MILRITTELKIDMDKCRARIKTPRLYNRSQRKWLLDVCDVFERGEFMEAHALIAGVKDDDWLEFLDTPIFDTVRDWALGMTDVTIVAERPSAS